MGWFVVIIRTRKFDIIKNNDFVKDNFDVYEMYSAGTNIEYDELNKTINKLIRRNDINTLLSKNKTALSKNITDIAELETKPLLVLIKGAFRAGITINDSHKDYIYMVYDHSLKADTTAQALLGRMCGYRKENSPIERTKIYVNMKFASMYSDWENDFPAFYRSQIRFVLLYFSGTIMQLFPLLVMFGIFAMQYVFVTFGGEVLSVHSLSPKSWLVCVILAVLVIPIDMIRKVIVLAFRKK